MTNRRPTDIIDSLRQTRRSMGDGTLHGRSRVATPKIPGESLDRVGVVARDGVDLTDPSGPGRGGNTPATVALYATDVSVPDDLSKSVEWSGSLEGDARANLVPVSLPAAELPLPYAGTWEIEIRWVWVPTLWWRGGGSASLLLDGDRVWPDTDAGESSAATPTPTEDLLEASWVVDIYAGTAGAEIQFVPFQDSGRAQTLARVEMVATLIEPEGAGVSSSLPSAPDAWSQVLEGDAWDLTFDGTSFWVTEGQSGLTVFQYDVDWSLVGTFETNFSNNRVRGITFDGTYLWMVGNTFSSSDQVKRYDTSGTLISTFDTDDPDPESGTQGIAWDGTDLWAVGIENDPEIRRYNISGIHQETIDLPAGTWRGITAFGGFLWVINETAAELAKIDPSDGSVLGTVSVSGATSTPDGVWISNAGEVYVSEDGVGVWHNGGLLSGAGLV